MDSLIHFSRQVLAVSLLFSVRAGLASAAEPGGPRTDIGRNGNTNQNVFVYQESEYPRDCHVVLRGCSSLNSSGVYVIKPDGYPEPFEVRCDFTESNGWTVIQRRVDGSVVFDRSWEDFKDGFGFLSNNYWLGNEKLSYLTNQAGYELRVDVELSDGSTLYVTYGGFRVSDEWGGYKLLTLGNVHLGGDGSITRCPRNKIYGVCSCGGTCEQPSGSSGCPGECQPGTEGCFSCPGGHLMDGDECVPQSECSCFWPELQAVVPEGESYANDDCTERRTCTDNQLVGDGGYRCGSNAECATRDGLRQCYCREGYQGDGHICTAPRDCYDVYNAGHRQDGVYAVSPTGWTGDPFNVSCEDGGWTVLQRRTSSNRDVNFYRDWASYREGFGAVDDDFWLGNEKLHYLTVQRNYTLRVDIVTTSNIAKYAEYATFRTAGEDDKYRLSLAGFSGDAGNAMYYAHGDAFSTYDSDNDGCGNYNCAAKHRGAWWYSNNWCNSHYDPSCQKFNFGSGSIDNTICTGSNLNGNYDGGNGQNINWNYHNYCNLDSVEMKIRPTN